MSARAGIGFVPQVHEIFARITVLDNLRMGLAYKRGNMAIVLVEQYYDFARDLADDYLVMQRGAVLARGKGQNMDADGVRELVAI